MIVYIHGFNSSPASHKARQLRDRLRELGRESELVCPALPHWPQRAIAELQRAIEVADSEDVTLIGSSLGGYYATWLTERYECRSVLLNPAIMPQEGLREYLGPQRNLYSNEEYVLTQTHLSQLRELYLPALRRPDRFLLLQTTGDELLDWRAAVARYTGSRQILIEGSDHGFREFEQYIDIVLAFAARV